MPGGQIVKVAYLTGNYPRATDTFIQREVAALRENGLDIDTFAVRAPGAEHMVGDELRNEYRRTTYILPANPVKLLRAHWGLLARSPGSYFRAAALAWKTKQAGIKGTFYQLFYFLEAGILAQEIRERGILHLHNHFGDSSCTVAMLAGALGEFDYSFTLHGPAIFYEPYHWRLDAKIIEAKFVACISDFCRSQAMFFSPFEEWGKLQIVHCGVDPALFDRVEHSGEGYRFLYVGRLSAAKGLPVLLESLVQLNEQYPQISLTVVGDGEDRAVLERLTQSLGLSEVVNFVGYKSQGEVRDLMQQTDIFVLPSFAEGVPVSLMEALAAGVPVVATRIAGISELIEDEASGYLVPPGNKQLLQQRIAELIASPELRQSFGEVGRDKVRREFDTRLEAMKLVALFEQGVA